MEKVAEMGLREGLERRRKLGWNEEKGFRVFEVRESIFFVPKMEAFWFEEEEEEV